MTTVKPKTERTDRGRNGRRANSETLLQRYRRKPSVKLRNRLVERYRPYVESIARALAARLPSSVDVQDLVHAGVWGLMQAIENFRAERGSQFLTFLKPRVRGAMLDELRNLDFLPRLYRQRFRERNDALTRLRSRLQREPSDGELASELGVSELQLRRDYTDVAPVRSLDGRAGLDLGDSFELPDEGLESPIEALERQDLLAKIEASLSPIEWTVLRMHYLEGMSGKDVARRLRLSASRICQIHVRVLARLKHRLRRDPPAGD